MSKGNMLLGHARGKVGDIVFSRANGEQVTRARAAVVKNPQTTAQMVQRVIALTIAQAYSQMAAICDHSFQGVAAGMSSMNFFRSRNMKMLRAKLAESGGDFEGAYNYTPLGTNIFVVNPYEVSTGRLPRITPNVGNGGVILEGAGTTYQNLVDKYGLQRGDQLTIVAIAGDSVDSQAFHFVRVILSPTNADGTKAEMSVPFINGTSVNLPNERNEGDFFTFQQTGSDVVLNCAGGNLRAAAVIVSRQVNGTWERSNATMIVADGEGMDVSMADALQGSASLSFASDRYLNNANTAGNSVIGTINGVAIVGYSTASFTPQGAEAPVNALTLVGADGKNYVLQCADEESRQYRQLLIAKPANIMSTTDYVNKPAELPEGLNYLDYSSADYQTMISKFGWTVDALIKLS